MRKLNVLINAYACSPMRGSEPGTGWNMCAHLAKHCSVHVITEGEFRDEIEAVLVTLPQRDNMRFYYNPVSERVRKMAWNQGDWRFYAHYKKWQKKTLEMAKLIVADHKIDILHQLNMIGYREPGNLWEIEDIPFVWGPIGGLKQFPAAYLQGADLKLQLFNRLKNSINLLQLKYDYRVNQAFKRASLLMSSIPVSYEAIKKYKKRESVLLSETGLFVKSDVPMERFYNDGFHVMWVGKFDFRKQLPLALKALAATHNKQIILDVYGQGNQAQEKEAKQLAADLKISDQIVWHGNRPLAEVHQAMREAQLFFFTSVSEDNPNVVLEALSNRLPVLCFDTCGFGATVNDKVGRKIPLTNPERSIIDFAEHLNRFYENRPLLEELSLNCKLLQEQLSWDEKAKKVVDLYHQVLSDFVLVEKGKR
ncbi:glycosyltransferase family 4 protein [Proteiniphilum sp. X52]|uniref:glycosyltransferase family 4 protein n=1 Tax=Proteiniphilum sp. X52 TaxID=2382159 RepID=UPI000F09DD1C|nr:glycosyltransferase family 4 protein [Proteiniphilum sp. X52]RNC63898.1 glycosyltransferase [Proteiniphilum sp. X52]